MDDALATALRLSLNAISEVSAETRVEQAALRALASAKEVLKPLKTILLNARDWPSIARYKRLRLENPGVAKIWACPAARELLEATGWEDHGQVAELDRPDAPTLAALALEVLESQDTAESQRPNICRICSRSVGIYGLPPRTTFFRRARSPNEGVVCTVCKDYIVCGDCFNKGKVTHNPDHVLQPLGYEEGPGMLSRMGGYGGGHAPPRRTPPSHRDPKHGRRGPWG